MTRYNVWVLVQIDATDPAQAFQHTRAIEALVRHPFVRGQIEGEGVKVAGELTVMMPKETATDTGPQ